jgi:hypothetical protein
MAETKQEKKTFKWGDSEYLLDDLLKLHAEQEQNYYNFARARGQYDDAALNGLRAAVANRINAVKNGQTFSADGVLDSDVVDNTSIQTQKKGLFKKEKYVDQDNTEWAKYYLNKLVSNLKPHQKEEVKDTGKWDINKHGLAAYLSGQGYDAKGFFEGYDKRNPDDPDAKRSFAGRQGELRKHLTGYKDWISKKGFDFTKNDNEWDDNFMSTLDALINNQDWSDSNALSASLRKLGAGEAYTTAFTSDRWDLSKSDAELAADAKKRKVDEEAALKKSYMDEYEDYSYGKRRESNPLYYSPFDYSAHNFDGKAANFRNWYADLNSKEQGKYGTYLGTDNQKWHNAWTSYINSLKGGNAYTDKNLGILLQGTFESQGHQFVDLGDGNYLIKDSVTDDGQGTVYNPTSGYTDTIFLGDFAGNNAAIKDIYKQLAYKYINSKYGTNYEDRPDVFKEGGELIPKNQYGSKVVYNWDTPHQVIKSKADAEGVSVEMQEARDQYIDKDNKSVDNPNAGLTAAQKTRIGYAILDLTSAVSAFFPGAGTTVSAGAGLTSTFGNLLSDLTDDAVTGDQAWKNFGLNLGMDALGLIPGGGAASKMGKIVKTLKSVVPYVIALPGVASMLSNSPEIAASWKKAFDGDPENGGSKMDYQDYMNILQVLNVATGVSNIAVNKYKSAKKSTKQTDKLAVDVVDATTKQRKALVLEGDDVGKFKEANAKGEAQKFVDELEGAGKYTINEVVEGNKGKFWGKNADGKFELFHKNPVGKSKTGKAHTLELKWDNQKGLLYAETGKWEADLGYNPSKSDEIIKSSENAWKRTTQAEVDAPFAEWRQKATTYKTNTDQLSQIRDKVDARIQAQNQSITDTQTAIESKQRIIDDSTAKASEIQEWLDAGGVTTSNKAIKNARLRIKRLKLSKAGKSVDEQRLIDAKIAQIEADIATTKATMDANTPEAVLSAQEAAAGATAEKSTLQVELGKLQTMLDKLTGTRTKLDTRIGTHSEAYNSIRDFQPIKKKFGDVEYTFNASPELRNLDGLYKHGGSINRNKINKFLNYAKG